MARSERTHGGKAPDYAALADLRYALRRFLAFSAEAARGCGLTPGQHQALLAIKGHRGEEFMAIAELAERLQLRHHSVVGLADRLEARGLVRRCALESDRRRVGLRLTPRGEQLIARLSEAHQRELAELGPELRRLLEGLEGQPVRGRRTPSG